MSSKVSRKLVSDVIRKQDTFYFESSKILPELKNSNEYCDLYKKTPVVALLGWAGSKPEHLQKYTQIYTDMGYHTIQFSPSNELVIFKSIKKHKMLTSKFLELFRENGLTTNQIFIHIISNASAMVLYKNILEDSRENFFVKNSSGIVYDCGIGRPGDLYKFRQAVSELTGFKQPILKYSFGLLLTAYIITFILYTDFFKIFINTLLMQKNPPLLFLYSKTDKIIGSDNISEFIKGKKGLFPMTPIRSVLYEDAEHTMIYKKYPDDYLKHIKEHLRLCNCDSEHLSNRESSKKINQF